MSLDLLRRWEERFGALPLPSPLAWAAMAAAFLGFGVLMGHATGGPVGSLASARTPVKVLVAQSSTGGASTSTAPTTTPPPTESEATPEPSRSTSESTKTTTKAATSKTSSSSSSSSSEGSSGGEESSAGTTKLPPIKHVWVVMLSDEPYATAFGPASPAHYLTATLEKQGELLVRYYAVAHVGLADGVALLSGQGPTEATAVNCPTYTNITSTGTGSDGQLLGQGCVYPTSTKTLMGQLTEKKLTWKAYVEGMGEGGGVAACAHPPVGATDPSASAASGYETWRNPFVYFQGITGSPSCVTHDVGLKALKGDLSSIGSTTSFSYIAPGPCSDGSPEACSAGKPSGMADADIFLKKVIPEILASKAYKKDGLLAITIDQAPTTGEYADSSSCCGQPKFPNLPAPTGAAALSPQGGGQVGMLLLSPFIKKGGGLVQDTYNHFSFLATLEQLFGLSKLGYAGLSEVKPLSPSLFSGG